VGHALVSVITPTWQRATLLLDAVRNLREQAYRPLEHVVVSDGPDPALRAIMSDLGGETDGVTTRFVELGRNWSSVLPNGFGVAPLTVGMRFYN
jgi:glycosyltransferase involved in cell wall biosynthesis